MDSEDICLSVFLCICVGEGMVDKTKPIIPAGFWTSGAQKEILSKYAPSKPNHRGAERDSVKISPGDLGLAGLRKRFCQNKPRGSRTSGAQKEILPG